MWSRFCIFLLLEGESCQIEVLLTVNVICCRMKRRTSSREISAHRLWRITSTKPSCLKSCRLALSLRQRHTLWPWTRGHILQFSYFICHHLSPLSPPYQVKNFGRSGRTKYTHLVDQDTTSFDSAWAQESAQNSKFFKQKAAGVRDVFDRPTVKKRKT